MKAFLIAYSFQLLRYLLVAGFFYGVFYVLKRDSWLKRKIQAVFPHQKQIRREIFYSLLSIIIFVLVFLLIRWLTEHGWTAIYKDFSLYGPWYFLLSVVLLIFFHDTYFYWTHRLLHHRRFIRFHKIHHLSHNTTPWTAFSFHPVEAWVQVGFIFIVLILPLHPIAILIAMSWQILFNVIGHLGYELFPEKLHNSFISKLFNTSTHHNMHHRYTHSNYGLYFNCWDLWMNTNHPDYEQQYKESVHKMFPSSKNIPSA